MARELFQETNGGMCLGPFARIILAEMASSTGELDDSIYKVLSRDVPLSKNDFVWACANAEKKLLDNDKITSYLGLVRFLEDLFLTSH